MEIKPSSTDTASAAPRWPRLRRELLIILFLTAFAVSVTWPLVTKMTTEIVGGSGDSHLFYWNYWWFNHAIFELNQDPFFCPLQLYPYGADLAFHTLCPFNCILALPFQRLFGIPFAYNLVILFSLVAAAYTAYRLAWDLSSDRAASVAAGIMFGFCPYLLMRATGHVNLVGAWPLPLVVMFAMRAFKTGRHRWAALAGLFGGLQLWIDMYYAVFAAMAFAILILNHCFIGRIPSLRSALRQGLIAAIASFLAASPILVFMGRAVLRSGCYFAPSPGEINRQGADLLSFVIPSHIGTLLGKVAGPAYLHLHGGGMEALLFPGICCLAFALSAIVAVPGKSKWFWTFLTVLCAVAALGEKVHIYGHGHITLFGKRLLLPLPMAVAGHIPILGLIRVSSRFAIVFQLAVVCLAALGVTHLLKKYPGRCRKAIVVVLFSCLFLDLACIPYFTSSIRHGRLYQILKKIPDDFAVMDVPFGAGDAIRWYGMHTNQTLSWTAIQLTHGKPVLGTLASRVDPQVLARYQRSPLVSAIVDAQAGQITDGELEALTPDVVRQELDHFNLKLIIVHLRADKPIDEGQLAYLFKHTGFKLLYKGDEVAVIETPLGPSLEKYVPNDEAMSRLSVPEP